MSTTEAPAPFLDDYLLQTIDVALIEEGERFRTEYTGLDDLIASIQANGLISPICVLSRSAIGDVSLMPVYKAMEQKGKQYLLLAGGRRLAAHKQAGLITIPAKVYQSTMDELHMRTIELAENIDRLQMPWQDEVALKKKVHDLGIAKYGKKVSTAEDAPGHTVAATAAVFGQSRATLSDDLKLASLVEKYPELAAITSKSDAKKLLAKAKKQATHAHLVDQHAKQVKEDNTGEAQIKQKLIDSFILKDCLEGMRQLPDNVCALVEIDPPYGINLHKQKKDVAGGIQDYGEIAVENWLPFMKQVLAEAYRVLKPGGWIICWFAPEPWFEPLFELLQYAGKPEKMSKEEWREQELALRGKRLPGVWTKPSGQNHQPDANLTNAYEMFFVLSKGRGYIYKPGTTNVFTEPPVAAVHKSHPTEKPVRLMMKLYQTFAQPGSFVLIPFAGSGNGLLAAHNVSMNAVGYDLPESGETFKNPFSLKVLEGKLGNLGLTTTSAQRVNAGINTVKDISGEVIKEQKDIAARVLYVFDNGRWNGFMPTQTDKIAQYEAAGLPILSYEQFLAQKQNG